eukprot:81641-Chlamydomonas_euryale.AAC.32
MLATAFVAPTANGIAIDAPAWNMHMPSISSKVWCELICIWNPGRQRVRVRKRCRENLPSKPYIRGQVPSPGSRGYHRCLSPPFEIDKHVRVVISSAHAAACKHSCK